MASVLVPLVILPLSALLGFAFLKGQRRNRLIASQLAHSLEDFYQPREKRYVNIGGVVGYHIFYRLGGEIRSLVGTLTLLPRHAILYLPISRLLGRRDQVRLTLHIADTPFGEGYIADPKSLERGLLYIEDEESLERKRVAIGDRTLLILYRNPLVAKRLEAFLTSLPTVEGLFGFSVSRMERNFCIVADPTSRNLIPLVKGMQQNLHHLEIRY
jgi:hypothetical protein